MLLNTVYMGRTEYRTALEIQENLLARCRCGETGDTLLLLEHPPVLTMGRRADPLNIRLPEAERRRLNIAVFETSRGGDVTYHGPGQVVGYPIFNLERHGKNIRAFVRNIQEAFIRLLHEEYGITAHREEGKYTGVYVGADKITAIGVAVRHWVTMHGFAFNVNTDLNHFRWINPCGLPDRGVTSLQKLAGRSLDFHAVQRQVARYVCAAFTMEEHACTLESLIG